MSSQPTSSLTALQNVEAWQKGRISPGDGAGAPGSSAGALVCSAQVRALDVLEEPPKPALRLGGHAGDTATRLGTLPPAWEGTLGTLPLAWGYCHWPGDTATGLGTRWGRCHWAGRVCWTHAHTQRVSQGQRSGPGEDGERALLPLGCRSQLQICHCHCDPLLDRGLYRVCFLAF